MKTEVTTEKKVDCCPCCKSEKRVTLCVGPDRKIAQEFNAEYRGAKKDTSPWVSLYETHHTQVEVVFCLDCGTVYVPRYDLDNINKKN